MKNYKIWAIICISFFCQSKIFALTFDVVNYGWSASTGGSLYLFGLASYPSETGCVMYFQNTTDPSKYTNKLIFGGTLDVQPVIGNFEVMWPIPINCSADADTYTLQVHCFSSFYNQMDQLGSSVFKTTGVCTP